MRIPLLVKSFFSPFKRPKLYFYFGKTAVGVPYFFPRKWIKATPKLAHKAVEAYISRELYYNKLNPDTAREIRPYQEVFDEKMKNCHAVDKLVGFSFCDIGWKTKYDSYRHEFNPVWSFVFFGYQVAVSFVPDNDIHYWECFLYYHFESNRKLRVEQRLHKVMKKYPCVWRSYYGGEEILTDYWELILKRKWRGHFY